MFIKRLWIKNFRSYSFQEVFFEKGANIIIGENGQGKTNLLEAIHFGVTGRSFKTDKLIELIKKETSSLYSNILYEQNEIDHEIKIEYGQDKKKVHHNATLYPTLSSLTGLAPTISITPTDISLLNGSPNERRRFLNLLISQHNQEYLYHLARHQKALKARNILLKRKSKQTIQAYEIILAQSSSFISQKRLQTLEELVPLIKKEFLLLTNNHSNISITYKGPNFYNIEYFLEQFNHHRTQEETLGFTLTGPHRDELLFFLDNLEIKNYASEGQKRAFITALKLAELNLLQKKTGLFPLLFVDDFAIHLDSFRMQLLESIIYTYPQVFLTTPNNVFQKGHSYLIRENSIKKLQTTSKS